MSGREGEEGDNGGGEERDGEMRLLSAAGAAETREAPGSSQDARNKARPG